MDWNTVETTATLAWAGWVSLMLIAHIKAISGIRKTCAMWHITNDKMEKSLADIANAITRIDRNIVRLGSQAGMDPGLESPPPREGV